MVDCEINRISLCSLCKSQNAVISGFFNADISCCSISLPVLHRPPSPAAVPVNVVTVLSHLSLQPS